MKKLKPYYIKEKLECGVDEAGLGPLAGPVYAAAVIFPQSIEENEENAYDLSILRDSKKLSDRQRRRLKDFIEFHAIDYAVASVDVEKIDTINIYHARWLAMHEAIRKLNVVPELLIIDGDQFKEYPHAKIEHVTCVGGDNKFQSVAAASILAKVARDDYMRTLHEEFPMYGWNTNKGYGTRQHYQALKEHGPTKHHRRSFNLRLENTRYTD